MDVFTPLFVVFGLNIDTFLLVVIIIVAILAGVGIFLMAQNVRPITGFLLLILALAMVIGVSYDAKTIKKELKRTIERFVK
ncbi:MAG TPA: hypothetical protein P5050_10090 [Bacteroidia bacterium]|nr:hypothetical protein [Bacteroidia bacterium]HRS59559.1 hypothetical protein [Bacteroidia bacterium]HRU67651.1 hypothetical protein [Bacteroidia bacterium]